MVHSLGRAHTVGSPKRTGFSMVKNSDEYGSPFSFNEEAVSLSAEGKEFSWAIAAYTPIHGDRENLEATPDRVLTDRELSNADTIVVRFGDGEYRTFASGPWEDWEQLWDDIMDWYDEY